MTKIPTLHDFTHTTYLDGKMLDYWMGKKPKKKPKHRRIKASKITE